MKLLLFIAFFAGANGFALFNKCGEKKSIFTQSRNPPCAVVYDEDGCRGEYMELRVGYTSLNSDLKEDAESLMVKPGCILIGYDEERSGFFEGHNAVFDAWNRSDPLINDNLGGDELDEEMKAANCYCRDTRGVGNVGRLPGSSGRCKDQTAIFNRPDSRPAALLYDEVDCTGRMKEVGVGDTNLKSILREDLNNDVESIMVRPGCTLIGTDHARSILRDQGSSVKIDASRNRKQPAVRNLSGSSDLEEDISAVSVRCIN